MPAPRKAQTQPRSRGTAKRLTTSAVAMGMPAAAAETGPPALPPRPKGMKYLQSTLDAWAALWAEPQAQHLTGVQKVVALRWILSFDEWQRALTVVIEAPMVEGSQGQPVANPMMGWVTSREAEMEKCEKQLGVGLKNKADLGLTIGQAKLTAQQLIEMHHQQGSTGDNDGQAAGAAPGEEDGWTAG